MTQVAAADSLGFSVSVCPNSVFKFLGDEFKIFSCLIPLIHFVIIQQEMPSGVRFPEGLNTLNSNDSVALKYY